LRKHETSFIKLRLVKYMKKKIIFDSILNIIATALPLLLLQLIVLPILGGKLGEIDYGAVLTLISLTIIFSQPFGKVVNNIRLLKDDNYNKNDEFGDFNLLLISGVIINGLIIAVSVLYFDNTSSILNVSLIVMVSTLNLIRQYIIVGFRLQLNYKGILVNNIILGLGYIFGLLLFFLVPYWQLIYITGYALSIIYISPKFNWYKEGIRKSKLFNGITKESIILFLSMCIKTIFNYADRLVLFPLMGPSAVTIYYTATLSGKLITKVTTPLTTVMLSYLVKMKNFRLKLFLYLILLTSIIGVFGYFVTVWLSKPMLYILYPQWAEQSLKLIYVTTATIVFEVFTSIINPFILRFNKMNLQLIIGLIHIAVAVVAVSIFYNLYGLLGFCIGLLIANVIKLILMLILIIKKNKSFV